MEQIIFLINLIIVAAMAILATLALLDGGHRRRSNLTFALFASSLIAWIISNYFSNNPSLDTDTLLFLNRLVFAAPMATLVLLTRMVVHIKGGLHNKMFHNIIGAASWLFVAASFTSLVVSGVGDVGHPVVTISFGAWGSLYGVLVLLLFFELIFLFTLGFARNKPYVRLQLVLVGIVVLVSVPVMLLSMFLMPFAFDNYDYVNIGLTPLVLLAVVFYYLVIKHRLFDIRQAAAVTMVYSMTLLSILALYVFLVYGVIAFIFHANMEGFDNIAPISAGSAIFASLLFRPVKRLFDKLSNRMFYRGSVDRESFLRDTGNILSNTTNLSHLVEKFEAYISQVFNAKFVKLFIIDHELTHISKKKIAFSEAELSNINDYYLNTLSYPECMVSSYVTDEVLIDVLQKNGIAITNPLVHQGKVVGLLLIGEHGSRQYNTLDFKIIESVVGELTIAIQNAIAVEKIRNLNRNLKTEVELATKELKKSNDELRKLDTSKDEFISMASHQLRTPLTSIKGYLSMVLEGDVGEIKDGQRLLLNEAFNSSERMVHLISDFLNVSRLSTGKFVIDRRPVDIAHLVEEETKLVGSLVDSRGLKLSYKAPADLPVLSVDEDKIRQVVMNFIDNAIFYSRERSTIVVKLYKHNNSVFFEVHDQGIGVPKDAQKKLFTKFFRAINARRQRPDGTGVGLFLAKKVITEHDGKIIFESTEGKGSVFGFSLPINK